MRLRASRSTRLAAAALTGCLVAFTAAPLRPARVALAARPEEIPHEAEGAAAPRGLVVVVSSTSKELRDAAWSLAQAVYANDALRPSHLDEASARALLGEPVPAGPASEQARNLSAMRDAVHGDDVASRALLAAIARATNVTFVVVVFAPEPKVHASQETMDPEARVYLAASNTFDAARYGEDPHHAWSGAAASLARTFGAPVRAEGGAANVSSPKAPALSPLGPVPAAATPSSDDGKGSHLAFYESPWFWAAVGAAALAGTATYFLTRDNDPSTIHLQLQVPK